MRTRGHYRARLVDTGENRQKVVESTLEDGFLSILRAHPNVQRVDEQPPAVTYVTDEGETARHTFDFRALLTDGRRIAYAVKPSRKVQQRGLDRTIARIREQVLPGFADLAMICTEREITRRRVHNAEVLLHAQRMRNEADVAAAREAVADLRGWAYLDDLIDRTGRGPRGRVALIYLIGDGELELEPDAYITGAAQVRPFRSNT
jgi:hypothetical protein